MNKFSEESCKKLQAYVYRLIDPRNGNTFYVGKGKGNRVFAHVAGELKEFEGQNYSDENDDDVSLKMSIIRDIHKKGLEVIYIIHRWGMDDKTAFEVESALIDAFPGLSNVVSGHNHERGSNNAETIEKILCAEPYDEPKDFKYIIIKVNQNRVNYFVEQGYDENSARYEATRWCWKTKPRPISQVPYVFSVTDSIVNQVYKISKWSLVPERERYEFFGEKAPENICKLFVGKKIPNKYTGKGKANPVLYSKN